MFDDCTDALVHVFAEIDDEEVETIPRQLAFIPSDQGFPEDQRYGWCFLETVIVLWKRYQCYLHVYIRVV